MDFRYCLGMMASVSTLARSSGATKPVSFSNLFIISFLKTQRKGAKTRRKTRLNNRNHLCVLCAFASLRWALQLSYIDKMPGDRRRRGHGRTDQMGAAAGALATLEVAIRGRGAGLARPAPRGVP